MATCAGRSFGRSIDATDCGSHKTTPSIKTRDNTAGADQNHAHLHLKIRITHESFSRARRQWSDRRNRLVDSLKAFADRVNDEDDEEEGSSESGSGSRSEDGGGGYRRRGRGR